MKLLLCVLLSMVLSFAHAERPPLEEGVVVRQSTCMSGKQKVTCVAVMVKDLLYVVMVDGKGEHSIYWISPKGDVLVWSRSSV